MFRRVCPQLLTLALLLAPAAARALPTTNLATMTQRQEADLFGFAVATGDLNGDGFGDVVVGAYKRDTPAHDAGAVDIFFGSASPDTTPDLTINGETADEILGFTVAAGDVNGDGYADVITGASQYLVGGSASGEIRVYFGGPQMDAVADWEIEGTGGEGLGYVVAYAGDVNGDGYGDIIAGNAAQTNAYVFYGGSSPDSSPDLTLTNDSFISVAGAGDVNGDGKADFMTGTGDHVYVYFGGSTVDATPDLTLTGSDDFGVSLASADVSGDGKSDVIVGADIGNRAYLYFGGSTPDANADLTFTGETIGDQFGFSVSAGDFNADGYADVLVGAPYSDAGGTDAGRAYMYLGGPTLDSVADLTMTGALAIDSFGYAVSSTDMNHDGQSDLVIGMYTTTPGNKNHVYVKSLILPSASQSYYVPQSGSSGSPSEGATAIRNFFQCPNNDGSALPNNARIKLVLKDSNGNPISDIPGSEINIRFNGGTPGPAPGQGFSGPDADSVIANHQYNPLANCPDVRRIPADGASDASGVAYLYFKGPGGVRDSNRKWGHYDTEIPVYALGVKLQGRLTSASSNGSYTLELKNMDVVGGLTTTSNQGELINTLDTGPMNLHQGELDSVNAINWWLDLNSDGIVNALDLNAQAAHNNHKCNSPNNP